LATAVLIVASQVTSFAESNSQNRKKKCEIPLFI